MAGSLTLSVEDHQAGFSEDTLLPDLAATRCLDNASAVRGKPSIVLEAGDAGVVEADDVALLVDETLNIIRARKMLSGDPRPIRSGSTQ